MRLASHYNFTFVTHPYFKCKSTALTLINMQLLLRIRTGNSPSSRFGEVGPQAGLTVNIPGRRQQPQCLPPFIMHHLLHVLLIYISQLCDFFLVLLVFALQCISCAFRFSCTSSYLRSWYRLFQIERGEKYVFACYSLPYDQTRQKYNQNNCLTSQPTILGVC